MSLPLASSRAARQCRATLPALFFLIALAACRREAPPVPQVSTPATTVSVSRVTRGMETRFQSVAGTIRPFERAVVAARVAGVVADADFTLGQEVAAGDCLLKIQASELSARLEQARAAADQAARDAAREAKLASQGASNAEDARAAEDRSRAARAALDEAQALHSYTRATAPFSGTVARKWVNTGDYASPGAPLFEIESRRRMRAHLVVPAGISPLPPGAPIRILAGTSTITGTLGEVSPALDTVTRTREAIVELPAHAPIQSGDYVRALWPSGETATISVPSDAIHVTGQIEHAFVVVDQKAVLRIVRTGARDGERVQVLSGLDAGEIVIVSPPSGLREGQTVKELP